MASRNPYSSLNHRNPTAGSSLFDSYPDNNGKTDLRFPRSQNSSSRSPSRPHYNGGAYSGRDSPYSDYAGSSQQHQQPYMNGSASHDGSQDAGGFRPATPNRKGQYSTSVLESLESQNDTTATSLLSSKVSQLKQLTVAIGDEIRDSSKLADDINMSFERTGTRLKGTMRRMLRMAERTGVGWKVWVVVLLGVWGVFAWVWLF